MEGQLPASSMQSVRYRRGDMYVLDQLKIPLEKTYIPIKNAEDAWQVIRDMNVRGAPLIAMVAALGLAVEVVVSINNVDTASRTKEYFHSRIEYLKTSRPTAVNLTIVLDHLMKIVDREATNLEASSESIINAYVAEAECLLAKDLEANMAIGKYGADAIIEKIRSSSTNNMNNKLKGLTHCNTGSLATAGYGTALGIIRALHERKLLERVFATETRPYNQGARLTSFEIVEDNLPGTLITDSMVASMIATKGLDFVVVGADRIVANGDTANKIGTYQIALIAKQFNVPFYVAASQDTIDLSTSNGKLIEIEERPGHELRSIKGLQIAPKEVDVWNPAFDVTPAELIAAIITENGVIYPSISEDDGSVYFNMKGFIDNPAAIYFPTALNSNNILVAVNDNDNDNDHDNDAKCNGNKIVRYTEDNLGKYLYDKVPNFSLIIGTENEKDLEITEVGDGNINFIFFIKNITKPEKAVIVKQALPYVRCVGESWPLATDRLYFEHEALIEQRKHCDNTSVPEIFFFDRLQSLIVMRYIEPPHIILRKALITQMKLSTISNDMGIFLAKTIFFTSAVYLSGKEKRLKVSFWEQNHAMCEISELVLFHEPYFNADNNHHTTPYLDKDVAIIRNDEHLKSCVSDLKRKFLNDKEALLHGDLHSGSIMVKEGSTFVFDPEFALYGPAGFDIGMLIANFLFSYFTQVDVKEEKYGEWILTQIVSIWNIFCEEFVNLWNKEKGKGELYKVELHSNFTNEQSLFLLKVFKDSIGFCGIELIRRIIGIAHVEDFESISDSELRANCERKTLDLARQLIKLSDSFTSIESVVSIARNIKKE